MVERWIRPATRPKVPTCRVHGLTVTQSGGDTVGAARRREGHGVGVAAWTPRAVWAAGLARASAVMGAGCAEGRRA